MRKFSEALSAVLESGLVKEDVIRAHIEQRATLDQILLNSDTFFYVFELRRQQYHFIGKQQESITGYKNEDFFQHGVELFLQCLHPDEIDCILNRVYRDLNEFVIRADQEDKKNLLFHYNYRFRRKDNEYVNLLELINILEIDQEGRPGLFLGNVTVIDNKKELPLRVIGKIMRNNGISETVLSKRYPSQNDLPDNITRRELDILRNLALGKTSKDIAREIFISPHTVDTHRRNLMRKLGCKSVVELARFAYRHALLCFLFIQVQFAFIFSMDPPLLLMS